MDLGPILELFGYFIYASMAACALYGVYCVIMLMRRIAQKRFFSESSAEQFLEEVRDRLQQRDYDAIAEKCDSPPFWSKAVPQLILVAIANRELPLKKLQRTVAEKFERDVLADLEYRTSWIATVVKSAPMLGLLGTVTGMINAFAKIASASAAGNLDPGKLADDISFALFTTALGLMIAVPLVVAGNAVHVRIGKMQDAVQHHIGIFLDDLDTVMSQTRG